MPVQDVVVVVVHVPADEAPPGVVKRGVVEAKPSDYARVSVMSVSPRTVMNGHPHYQLILHALHLRR